MRWRSRPAILSPPTWRRGPVFSRCFNSSPANIPTCWPECNVTARARGLLIAYGYSFPVATTLAVLMTEAERQPVAVEGRVYHVPVGLRHCVQGAPTSPGLCNVITLRLDRRLSGLAKKHGFAFTRYADVLTFSGDADRPAVQKLRIAATRIIMEEGFTVNTGKTRAATQSSRQTVTGVVVNQTLGLSREEMRRLNTGCKNQHFAMAQAAKHLRSAEGGVK